MSTEQEVRELIRELNYHAFHLRDHEDGEWDQELIDGWEEAADLLDRAAAVLTSVLPSPATEPEPFVTLPNGRTMTLEEVLPYLPADDQPAACALPGHQGCEWFGAILTHHPSSAPTELEGKR